MSRFPLLFRCIVGLACGALLAFGAARYFGASSDKGTSPQSSAAPEPVVKQRAVNTPLQPPRTLTWEDLLPVGWDPMKEFKNSDIASMGDADPRAAEMLRKLRSLWDDAPIRSDLDGQNIRLPGYVVPIEMTTSGVLEFLLVPYFGACIHTPPPPSNQIIHVVLNQPAKDIRSMDTVWINGIVTVKRATSLMGTSGYRMELAQTAPYKASAR